MAVKKAEKAAEAAEEGKVVNDTPEQDKSVSGADNEAIEEEKKEAEQEEPGETVTLVYIGPQLPAGLLKTNKVIIGTQAEIEKELAGVLEKYPLVKKMLVPVEKLAEKKNKAATAGNILNKYYTDIVSSIVANEKREG